MCNGKIFGTWGMAAAMPHVREYRIVDPEKQMVSVYDFEKDMVEQYNFGVDVPVGIYDGFSIKVGP